VFVLSFTKLVMTNVSLRINKIKSWPIMVLEGMLHRILVIYSDRVIHRQGSADIVDILLESKLGRVHPNHDQSLIRILLSPSANIRELAQPIDAGMGPKVDEDDFSAQCVHR
jgi:hypothetical protein